MAKLKVQGRELYQNGERSGAEVIRELMEVQDSPAPPFAADVRNRKSDRSREQEQVETHIKYLHEQDQGCDE